MQILDAATHLIRPSELYTTASVFIMLLPSNFLGGTAEVTEQRRDKHSKLFHLFDHLEPHDHLCLIYESREEWLETVMPFIISGLKQ